MGYQVEHCGSWTDHRGRAANTPGESDVPRGWLETPLTCGGRWPDTETRQAPAPLPAVGWWGVRLWGVRVPFGRNVSRVPHRIPASGMALREPAGGGTLPEGEHRGVLAPRCSLNTRGARGVGGPRSRGGARGVPVGSCLGGRLSHLSRQRLPQRSVGTWLVERVHFPLGERPQQPGP